MEGLFNGSLPHLEKGFDEYDIVPLGSEDIRTISTIPGRFVSGEELFRRLKEGKKCLGVKHHGEVTAFTWYDLDEFNFKGYTFPLKENEAYLFDTYTLISFRGKGIAPYMRYQCYKELANLGRHKLYSITERFNTPAVKFKEKLNAKLLELYVYIELFKKWHFHSRLKKYTEKR